MPSAWMSDSGILATASPLESVMTPSLPVMSNDVSFSSTAELHTKPDYATSFDREYSR